MKFYLHEITEQDKKLAFTEAEDWIRQAVASLDEKGDENGESALSPIRPIEASFSLRKVDEVFIVSGQIKTGIKLLCSRCATIFSFPCMHSFSSLFCQDPTLAGIDLQQTHQNRGFARHEHEEQDPSLGVLQDMDITHITVDTIDLADILKEQLHLQIPFQPLCEETCKGICFQCGADLNLGRCACSKFTQQAASQQTLARKNAFAALGSLKQKS